MSTNEKVAEEVKGDSEFTKFLIRQGWDEAVARQITVSTGCEEEQDILDLPKTKIDSLEYLSDEQKEKLWKMVCDAWRALSPGMRRHELANTNHKQHKQMIFKMLKRDDVREKRLGALTTRMFEIIKGLPLNEVWAQELKAGLDLDEEARGILFEAFEHWEHTSQYDELMKLCRCLWFYTDPSRQQSGHEDPDIFKLITKWKGLHEKYGLNELENVLFEFNSQYCKYALLELDELVLEREGDWHYERRNRFHLTEQLKNTKSELQREERKNLNINAELQREQMKNLNMNAELKSVTWQLQNVTSELKEEKKKNEELNLVIWKERSAYDQLHKRANIQGLLLQLQSMGDVNL